MAREIVDYASLGQTALQSANIIAESLNYWRQVPDAPKQQGVIPRSPENSITRVRSRFIWGTFEGGHFDAMDFGSISNHRGGHGCRY